MPLDALLAQARVAPEYTMGVLVDRSGIPPETLRSWERRYDFPQPTRTDTNRRLYSERDIAAIAWLKEQTDQGQGIREAIAMVKSRLASKPGTGSPPESLHIAPLDTPIQTLTAALSATRLDEAQSAWDTLAIAASPDALGLRVILPILEQLGDAAHPEQALAFLHRKANVLLDHAHPDAGAPTIAILISGGHDVEVGATVLAASIARRGSRVITPFTSAGSLDAVTQLRGWSPDQAVLVQHRGDETIDPTTLASLLGVETVHTWTPSVDDGDDPSLSFEALIAGITRR